MPELPEVETVTRLIRPPLLGRTIRAVEVDWARSLGEWTPAQFRRRVVGARIERVHRRAKYILIDLSKQDQPAGHLVVHLRMTGRMQVLPGADAAPAYDKLRVALDDGYVLHFIDVRKFGRFTFQPSLAALEARLGPEPLGESFTEEWLWSALRRRKRALKPLLLDQAFLAGLGNIYVDEALFTARLHPLRRSDRVQRVGAQRLHRAIQDTLQEAIRREGSSFDAFYRTPEGQPGSYQDQFQVYGRTGKACQRCGGLIRRLVVGQRGTHICPRCQRAPR